jgi:lipoate-protein ligase A
MLRCHLIVDSPADGAWNMARDEALLESAKQEGFAYLRFYSWRQSTLSLGYFQSHADRTVHAASANCPFVRRASGGGAIVHDRELTYSTALPQSHPAATRAETLYWALHRSLVCSLAEYGINAVLAEEISKNPAIRAEPFLCFQRRTEGDVLLDSHKIAGSAQRRHHRAVLQHGSVLFGRSPAAPELPGIRDLANNSLEMAELRMLWQQKIAEQLNVKLVTEPLPRSLLDTAQSYLQKFSSDAWNFRR